MRRRSRGARAQALAAFVLAAWATGCTHQLELDVLAPEADAASAPPDAAPGGSDRPPVEPDPALCEDPLLRELSAEMGQPVLMLAVERSSSMLESLSGSTRLEAVAAMVPKVLANRRLSVGLVQFPGPAPFCDKQSACCASPVLVAPRADDGRAIVRLLRCEEQTVACFETDDAAPAAAALSQVRTLFRAVAPSEHRAAILITDGDPRCGQDESEACEDAIREAAAMAEERVSTYVLAVGGEAAGAACLPRIAEAGRTQAPGRPLVVAVDDKTLEERFTAAVAEVEDAFCRVRIRFAPRGSENVRLFIEGVEVPRAAPEQGLPSSWDFEAGSPLRMRVRGDACASLKRQPLDLRVFEVCCREDRDCR